MFYFLYFAAALFPVAFCQNYDCYPSTTKAPAQFNCKRDIVIAIDGTPYMGNGSNVVKEIDFIEQMLSNWTFGDNGVNVAFITYGFNGKISFSIFYDNFEDCKSSLEKTKDDILTQLKPTLLTSVIKFVVSIYGGGTPGYSPREGIEPRLIAFTSTANLSDIMSATTYFNNLYQLNYDTVLCVAYANLNFYHNIPTLATLAMENFSANYYDNVTQTIETKLCVHDDRFTPSPCPSTMPSTKPVKTTARAATTTPVPTKITTVATTTASHTGGPPAPGTINPCNCVTQHLWLDVIVVIDNSKSMTEEGLSTVKAHILTVFGGFTTLDQSVTRSIRLGIVSMSDFGHLIADFNAINSPDDAITYLDKVKFDVTKVGVNIDDAFKQAAHLIDTQGADRNNSKKVIILYTSAYTSAGFNDPVPVSDQLKASGTTIIGVEFIQESEGPFIEKLDLITSPNMTFSNNNSYNFQKSSLLNITLEALCWVNCFCVNLWSERKNPFTVAPTKVECFYMSDIDSGWTPAKDACEHMAVGSMMTAARNYDKFEYLINLLASLPSMAAPPIKKMHLHLGVFYNASIRNYEFLDGSVLNSVDYMPWDQVNGFPQPSLGSCVEAIQGRGLNVNLQNVDCFTKYGRYACELSPCDTENYCPNLDI